MLALAEHPDSVFFPGLKIFTGIYNKDNENSQLQAILAHESIHWMGYEHYKNFDLSYVAEMCCLDHKDDFLNEIGQKSCEMFKFKNKEWTNPEYVGNLTKNLGYFGRHFVGLATSFAAAIHSKQLNVPKKDIFKIFEYTAFAYADGSDSDDPKTTKYYASSPDVTQAIVLAYLTENQESTFNKVLLKKYFNNKNKTLRFFRLFSQTISHLIFGSNSDLIQSWLKFKNYEKEICPNLETYEKEALAEMAFYTYENLFDKIKTEGATLDELRMLTDWTKICGPKTPVLKSI